MNLEMFEGAEAASHALGPVEQPVDGFGHAEVLSGGTEPRGLVGFHRGGQHGGQLSSRPSATSEILSKVVFLSFRRCNFWRG